MIKLLEMIQNTNRLDSILEIYRERTNWTDWYMNGGCYTFADALYQFLGKRGKFVSVGEFGTDTMAHMCILYKGLYCDYNGCRRKDDILNDISVYGKVEWKLRSRNDVMGEHDYSSTDVRKIVKELNNINENI